MTPIQIIEQEAKPMETINEEREYLSELKTLLKKHKKRKKIRAVEAVKTLIEKAEERIKRTKIEEK